MGQSIPTDVFPAFPAHAKQKWMERSEISNITLSQAWYESVPVGIPDSAPWGPRAVLHDPANAVLIYTTAKEKNKEYVVKTVLQAELLGTDYSLNDGNLVVCDACGYRYDRGRRADSACHWCECGYESSTATQAELEA